MGKNYELRGKGMGVNKTKIAYALSEECATCAIMQLAQAG